MSKKKNKNKIEKTQDIAVVETPSDIEELAPSLVFSEQMMSIGDAASRHIEGYRPHWLPAIKSFAINLGIDPNSEQGGILWRSVFIKWGAVVK